ncbi:hypothetical protein ACH9L7_16210 (plasmid) [Haloferax sp. S1W]|uniref:hypothetical protein n=1 Tax=Haloferax sp. S1W TaxID=3377110 RepID=UPI0037C56ED8
MDTPVVYTKCGSQQQVGAIEQYATLWENTSDNLTGKEEWALAQRGNMLPSIDNDYMDNNDAYGAWINRRTEMVQNWDRSELGPVDHIAHAPSKNKKSSFDTSISASAGGPQMTANYEIPYIARDVNYVSNKKLETVYTYPSNHFGQEAQTVDCDQEQIGIWETQDPSDGDSVVPSYYFGKFGGLDLCSSNKVDESDTLFSFIGYESPE